MTQAPIETFRCVPMACALTPASCGKRHQLGGQPTSTCPACPVGAAHARGERPTHWPDGTPIVRLGIASASAAPPPEPERKRHTWHLTRPRKPTPTTDESTMPRPAEKITYQGETLTAPEWAKRLGVSESTIYTRHKAGKPLEPERAKPGKVAQSKPAKRAPSSKPARTAAPAESADPLRDALRSLEPADLLARLGYQVEHLGRGPRGQLLHILDEVAPA